MDIKHSTREKILDEVFILIYLNGYNATSMSMILKQCNIPKGSLYHYFKSKKEMVLASIRERLAPKINLFYELNPVDNEHPIDTIINNIIKISQKDELVKYGCPLNRLNQEMSSVDKDFDIELNMIYDSIREKIIKLLNNAPLKDNIHKENLTEFIIASIWGSLSLSPSQSSKERYLSSVEYLISYLKSLKNKH